MHVLITGTSSGLGSQLASRFLGRGYKVTGTTHESDLANNEHMLFYDASRPDAHMLLAQRLKRDSLQKIDLLINNAGMNAIRHFHDLTLDFMEYVMRINCHMPVLLVRELLATEMFTPKPVIINIVSDAAWRPMRHSEAYNTSKAAFDMATRQMARELTKPLDLTVIGIRPGKMSGTRMSAYIDKEVQDLRGWTAEEARAYFVNNSITGREQHPQDVARFIQELYENPLVRTMSGACIDLVG